MTPEKARERHEQDIYNRDTVKLLSGIWKKVYLIRLAQGKRLDIALAEASTAVNTYVQSVNEIREMVEEL